jgi:hypothetical protein
MDVSVWWVVVAALLGLYAGVVLFAVLTLASERGVDVPPETQPQTPARDLIPSRLDS